MVSGNNSFINVQSIIKNNAYLVAYVLWDLLLFHLNSLSVVAEFNYIVENVRFQPICNAQETIQTK